MKLPSREWTGALVVSVIAVVLAALDILDGSVHRWWAEHAFTTTLVGGILVLLVTVLIADRVVNARQLRDRSRAIAAQAAIVMTQAARTAQVAIAMLEGTGDRDAVGDELRSYGTMLLISAPILIDASLSPAFLEEAHPAGRCRPADASGVDPVAGARQCRAAPGGHRGPGHDIAHRRHRRIDRQRDARQPSELSWWRPRVGGARACAWPGRGAAARAPARRRRERGRPAPPRW